MEIIVDSCVFINAMKEDSEFREQCLNFLEYLSEREREITMPAHGWFEVWCNLKRIEKIDKKFKGESVNGDWKFPVKLIHIDSDFIGKYGNIDIPYIKAADHIFVVVAYVNGYPLVTTDGPMAKKAKEIGVKVYTPEEFIASGEYA
jgi:predicted nucleic acid-binding protein